MRHFCTPHLILPLLFMISVTACQSGYSIPPTMAPSPSPAPSLTPRPTSIVPPSWVAYRDPAFGISLWYPPDWFVYPAPSAESGNHTIISSFDLGRADPDETGESLRHGGSRVDIGFHPAQYDPRAALGEWLEEKFADTPLVSIQWTDANIADLQAAILSATDANGVKWAGLAVVLNGSVLIVWGAPSSPEMDQILYGIRFR
jgi:hypothetical protein